MSDYVVERLTEPTTPATAVGCIVAGVRAYLTDYGRRDKKARALLAGALAPVLTERLGRSVSTEEIEEYLTRRAPWLEHDFSWWTTRLTSKETGDVQTMIDYTSWSAGGSLRSETTVVVSAAGR